MFNIYILKCMQNTYYIGKTNLFKFTLENYNNINEWTLQFKPIFIHKFFINKNDDDLYNITLKYMSIYGIHTVRSDIFNKYILSELDIYTLKRNIQILVNK